MDPTETTELLDVAERCARLAGAIAVDARPLEISEKLGPRDLVTEVDRACEAAIRALLADERPDDAIAGEELGAVGGTTGLRWGVDPIDGTTNFASGVPHWCVSVGVEDGAGSLVGVVLDPVAGELFAAARGTPPTLNDRPSPPRRQARLEQALLAYGIDADWWQARGTHAETIDRLLPAVAHGRQMGSMALDMGWTAVGRFDAYYYESGLRPHDVAQRVILESAGLAVHMLDETDTGPSALLAAPAPLASALLRLLGREDTTANATSV